MSVGGSNVSPSFFHSISIGMSPEEMVQETFKQTKLFRIATAVYLTAVALFQVSIKSEGRYFWRLNGPQQDMSGCLLPLAV